MTDSNFKDAFNAGMNQVRVLDGDVALGVTRDGVPTAFSLEEYRGQPQTKRGAVLTYDERSFAEYVIRHREPGSVVYYDPDDLTIVAVLDGHSEGQPGWNNHRVSLHTRLTAEWADWTKKNREAMNQVQLAEFIENHVEDVATPAGATLLEMVKAMSIRKNVVFESGVELHNGQVQLKYHETTEAGAAADAGKNTLTFPRELVLGLSPFKGLRDADGKKVLYALVARLRWRLDGSALKLWLELVRPELVRETAFTDRLATVVKRLAGYGVPTSYGVPPSVVDAK